MIASIIMKKSIVKEIIIEYTGRIIFASIIFKKQVKKNNINKVLHLYVTTPFIIV